MFGSLFAGIGGLDLGLERAGMECAWQVEIDDYCQRVLTKHWPTVPKFRDIRDCGAHNLAAVDLICGGFPCQPFSVAGMRRGTADDRHLWPEMLRVIDELRPSFVLGENVPGLIPMALDEVLDDLEACGYEARAITFPAASLGAWHRRDRLWIIAYSKCDRLREWPDSIRRQERTKPSRSSSRSIVANTLKPRLEERPKSELLEQCAATERGCTGANSNGESPGRIAVAWKEHSQWLAEPGMGGMVDGISYWLDEPDIPRIAVGVPDRVNRLKALGNSVVPQCAEFIGRLILQAVNPQAQAERSGIRG